MRLTDSVIAKTSFSNVSLHSAASLGRNIKEKHLEDVSLCSLSVKGSYKSRQSLPGASNLHTTYRKRFVPRCLGHDCGSA